MYKRKIPQRRSDILTFRVQVGRALIRENPGSGKYDTRNSGDCLARYEEWAKLYSDEVDDLKRVAKEALLLSSKPREKRRLREILRWFMVSNRHNYEDRVTSTLPRYLAKLIVGVQEEADEAVLKSFLQFLVDYL